MLLGSISHDMLTLAHIGSAPPCSVHRVIASGRQFALRSPTSLLQCRRPCTVATRRAAPIPVTAAAATDLQSNGRCAASINACAVKGCKILDGPGEEARL